MGHSMLPIMLLAALVLTACAAENVVSGREPRIQGWTHSGVCGGLAV
ncbi:MAG: hypothetical protein P8076_09740 [Gammaproteobacteria bacterium]